MGWKGTLREIERSAKRRQRELEKQRKLEQKRRRMKEGRLQVEEFENYLETITSIHTEVNPQVDWEKISRKSPPPEPTKQNKYRISAQKKLNSFKPSLIDKLFKRTNKKVSELKKSVKQGENKDKEIYQEKIEEYKTQYKEWEIKKNLSEKIISGDIPSYLDAVKIFEPFTELQQYGVKIQINAISKNFFVIDLFIPNEEIVPDKKISQLKSGKLSIKDMPKTHYFSYYQDFVCSCALRAAREIFGLLPIKQVIVNVHTDILNSSTGHIEKQPILSVFIPEENTHKLNFSNLDPSDSMSNFIHNMKHLKTKGFKTIDVIEPDRYRKNLKE